MSVELLSWPLPITMVQQPPLGRTDVLPSQSKGRDRLVLLAFLSTQEATGGSWLWTAPDVGVRSHSWKSSRIDLLQETQSPHHPSVA